MGLIIGGVQTIGMMKVMKNVILLGEGFLGLKAVEVGVLGVIKRIVILVQLLRLVIVGVAINIKEAIIVLVERMVDVLLPHGVLVMIVESLLLILMEQLIVLDATMV
jgi:hypothetical protein